MHMDTRLGPVPEHLAAVIWLDRSHALVARANAGRASVTEVDRDLEPESMYLRRILHEAADCDRLVVMGPDAARIAFEREYVSIYRRPDRLIDVGCSDPPRQCDLVDQLRMLDPSLSAVH
jgi:hypothetical protein